MAQRMEFKRHIHAPPETIYRLLTDAKSVQRWKVPDGMSSLIHEFNPAIGGKFRVSLTYQSPDEAGKSSAHTDTYHGRFKELIPNSKVVEVAEFETRDPAMAGEMTITYELIRSTGGTDLIATHEGLPEAVPASDNELGWKMSLDKLTAMAEADNRTHAAHD
ncbi:MAG: SRPBCC domain-containing protein [Achromobacter mucicolens]